LRTAYDIITSPFKAVLDFGKIALFTPMSQQWSAAKEWFSRYMPKIVVDKLFPATPAANQQVAEPLPPPPPGTTRRGGQ
jgi:hypothetical protein